MKPLEALGGGCGLLVLLAIGAGLLLAGSEGLGETLAQREWLETSCEIERSWVTGPFPPPPGATPPAAEAPPGEEPAPDDRFRFRLTYRYEPPVDPPVGPRLGTAYSRKHVAGGYPADAAETYRLRDTYRPGEFHTCYVDRDDPGRVTLRREGFGGPVLLGLGGLLLLAAAIGGFLALIRAWRRRVVRGAVTPISSGDGDGDGFPYRIALGAFFGLFLLAGLAALYFMGGEVLTAVRAVGWQAHECTVLSSEVESHHSDDGTTYSVEMVYAYEWDGRPYHGDRYDLFSGSSSGSSGKVAVVARHPAGAVVSCRVSPDTPWESVIEPSLFPGVLWLLLPLVFLTVGGGGLFFVLASGLGGFLTSRRRSRPGSAGETASFESPSSPADGARVLEPESSPRTKFWLSVVFAVFWNGITWTVVWAAVSGGGLDGCLTVFLGVFVLVGLGLLVNVPYQFLALFNPRPRLEIDGPLHPGARPTVRWSFTGRPERLRGLRLVLTGHEHATYRRGTDTHTARSEFARVELADLAGAVHAPEIARGSRELAIPADAVPSFKARRNVVAWKLELRGDVPRWPDVLTDFPVEVEPAPPTGGRDRPPRRVRLRLVEGTMEPGSGAAVETVPCEPGDRLAVMVSWDLPETARHDVLRDLELRLVWFTSGRGDEDRETVWRRPVLEGHGEALPARGEALVEVDLPRAPYSFSGELISLQWVLELVADFEELGESASRLELVLAPGGREVRLGSPEAGADP